MHDTNVVFEVRVSKDETFFEQVYIYIFKNLFEINCELFAICLQFVHFKLIYLGIICVSAGSKGIITLSHIRCAIGKRRKPSTLVVKA
jgi:hypothetical protein